jgi:hypothetical protein
MSNAPRRGITSDTERARHIASAEVAGFATTAATMLLGLIAGAEARDHAAQPQDTPSAPPPHLQAPVADHAAAAAVDPSAASGHDAAAAAPLPHAAPPGGDPAPVSQPAAHAAGDLHAHAAGSTHVPEPIAPVLTPHGAPALDHVTLHAPAAPSPLAVAANLDAHQPAPPLDSPLASLSQIGETLNTTLHQITATLTSDLAHVASGLSDVTATLTSSLSGLTADVQHAADGLAQPMLADAAPHLDAAGAVPLHFLQVPPLQLGFLGQPTADGHDTHDGAFSALGAHHF